MNSSVPRVARDEAGPSHQAAIVHNRSLESSIRSRIRFLEDDKTIFLLGKEKGEYWNEIRGALEQAPSREEYTRLLEFENRDLRIWELKHSCFSQFQQVLSEQPALKENTDYDPEEALIDFFNKKASKTISDFILPSDQLHSSHTLSSFSHALLTDTLQAQL